MFCGLLTVVFFILVLVFLPDSPMEAKCLTEKEKVIAIERFRANQMGIISLQWRWDHAWEALYDVKFWLWFLLIVTILTISYVVQRYREYADGCSIPSGGIGTFGNLIIKSSATSSLKLFCSTFHSAPFRSSSLLAEVG